MSALPKAFAASKAAYDERERAGAAGNSEFNKLVSKSDRLLLKLAKMRCASDDEFFAKLAFIVEIELSDYGDPEGQNFESTLIAVRSYLEQRKVAAAA